MVPDDTQPPSPLPRTPEKPPRIQPSWRTWYYAVAAAASFAVAGVVLLMSGHSAPSNPPAQDLAARTPAHLEPRSSSQSIHATDSPGTPKWTLTRQSASSSGRARTVEFELPAENEIGVWMKRVRPALVVRCLDRQTDVFVVTDSAMRIESTPDRRTVRVGVDDAPDVVEHWIESKDQRELFAPDAIAMTRTIGGARTLRFGFTPFNAPAVVVEFDVRGFVHPLESVAKACGWDARAAAAAKVSPDKG